MIYSHPVSGNSSEFTVCLRIKSHYKRPEFVLFSSYSINRTAIVIGEKAFLLFLIRWFFKELVRTKL